MNDITVEKKLQLINQVRSRYHRDQDDLLRREQLLYGKTSERLQRGYGPYEEPAAEKAAEPAESGAVQTLRLRVMAALVLFVLLLVMDQNGKELFGISSSRVFAEIAKDYMTEAQEALNHLRDAAAEGETGQRYPEDAAAERETGQRKDIGDEGTGREGS